MGGVCARACACVCVMLKWCVVQTGGSPPHNFIRIQKRGICSGKRARRTHLFRMEWDGASVCWRLSTWHALAPGTTAAGTCAAAGDVRGLAGGIVPVAPAAAAVASAGAASSAEALQVAAALLTYQADISLIYQSTSNKPYQSHISLICA